MNNFFKSDNLSNGVKGLVFIGDKIIVYRRDTNAPTHPLELDLPGGGREDNETPFETFRREIKEEFNLTIQRKDITYAKRFESFLQKGLFGWYAAAQLPKEAKKDIVLGSEGVEYFLMSVEAYIERDDAWSLYQQLTAEYISETIQSV